MKFLATISSIVGLIFIAICCIVFFVYGTVQFLKGMNNFSRTDSSRGMIKIVVGMLCAFLGFALMGAI